MIERSTVAEGRAAVVAKIARFLLYSLLIWVPLPLASDRPIFWAINAGWAALILAFFVAGELQRPPRTDIDWKAVAWIASGLLAVSAWMVVQALPGMPPALRHPAWNEFVPKLAGASNSISIAPGSTWATIAQVVPCFFLAVVAMRLSVDRQRRRLLLNVILAATLIVAVYGLVAQYAGFRQVFLLPTDAYPGFLTGTFNGRSAAASYFVIGICCATAMLTERLQAMPARLGRYGNAWLRLAEVLHSGGIYLFADVVLVAALLDTGSRGGTIACAVALCTIGLLSFWGGTGQRRATGVVVVIVFVLLLAIAAVSSGVLLHRLQTGVGTGARLLVYRDTIDMILARPWLGQGAGAFVDAFPLFHSRAPSDFAWNRAHDTYLQAAAELGLPAFLVLMATAVGAVVVLWRHFARYRSGLAVVAALAAAAGLGFHATVDFSLQVQAVGLTFAVLLGAGLGEALRLRRQTEEPDTIIAAVEPAGGQEFHQCHRSSSFGKRKDRRRSSGQDGYLMVCASTFSAMSMDGMIC